MTNERELKIIENSVRIIREKTDFEPEIGMILGSGLGDYADKIENPVKISYHDIPDFPVSTVAGHAGQFVLGTCMGKRVIAMQGRVHYYEGYSQRPVSYTHLNDTPKAIKDSISEMPVTISAFSMGMFVIPIIIVLGTSLMD